MKKWLLLISGLLMAPNLLAAVTMTVPMNYQLLAVEGKHLPGSLNQIVLSGGQQNVLVQFISQENQYNSNELSALIRSKPIRINFVAPEQGEIRLKPPILTTPDDIKRYAKQPSFVLLNEKNIEIAYQAHILTVHGSPLNADYNELLANNLSITATNEKKMTQPANSSAQENIFSIPKSLPKDGSTPISTDDALQNERIRQLEVQFMAASPQERKAFLSWAVSL